MKLGALTTLAGDVERPGRMFIVDPDTKRVLTAAGLEKKPDGSAKHEKCYIDFLSVDSEAGRRLDRTRTQAQLAKLRSGRNRGDDAEDDDLVKMQIESLVELSTGWFFGSEADGYSKESAAQLFTDPKFSWLRRDGWVFVHETANFILSSSSGSAPSPSTTSAASAS